MVLQIKLCHASKNGIHTFITLEIFRLNSDLNSREVKREIAEYLVIKSPVLSVFPLYQ